MTPKNFWLTAAQWGSAMYTGDPGACMYGFDEHGMVQSEEHRQNCIDYIESECREAAKANENPESDNRELDTLIAYLRTAPIYDDLLYIAPALPHDNQFVPTHTPGLTDLDAFTIGYLECAEFTECNEDAPEMQDADGFSPEFIEEARDDCANFQKANADALALYYEHTGRPEDHAGHDFWLTRNRHGAGFWDRISTGNPAADKAMLRELTDAAHVYGSVDLYVGDDNLIYGG